MRLPFGIEIPPAQPIATTPMRATPPPGSGFGSRMFFFKWCKNFPAHRSRVYAPRPSFKGARFPHAARDDWPSPLRPCFSGSNCFNGDSATHPTVPRFTVSRSEHGNKLKRLRRRFLNALAHRHRPDETLRNRMKKRAALLYSSRSAVRLGFPRTEPVRSPMPGRAVRTVIVSGASRASDVRMWWPRQSPFSVAVARL